MLDRILNLTPDQKQGIEREIGPLKSVVAFCSDLLEATKEIPLKDRFGKLLPWALKGYEFVSEVTPLARVLLKILREIGKENDPETLGLIACSLAYQRSAALALVQQGEPMDRVPFQEGLESAKRNLRTLAASVNLEGFSLEAPTAHPFIWTADDAFSLVVRQAGYSPNEWRQIQSRIHSQFRADLVEVLSHGETASRFEPFTKQLSMGETASAYIALNAHIERQRRLFEEKYVLNIEPFTLQDVYVPMDCGKLDWSRFPDEGEFPDAVDDERFDPFSESFGGRHDLLRVVLDYFRDPTFSDAVVVQGAPGSGKSTFTLYLADVLRREGLRPLRIRLKFLDLRQNLSDALAKVVLQPEEDEGTTFTRLPSCSDPFLKDKIFDERTRFGDAEICPYVLILDGWDEISVAVNEGFEIEVHRMLRNVRQHFLLPRSVKVRLLITGRPSDAVERSQFLRSETPVLTLREYTDHQLRSYVDKLQRAVQHPTRVLNVEPWSSVRWDNLYKTIESYRADRAKLDILGLPLLAHLSLRLLAEWKGEAKQLLSDRTTLYRSLLDLTCAKAGKAPSESDDLLGQERISGHELRKMLQQTAIAITAYGSESIPFRELTLRLKKSRKQTMFDAEIAGKTRPLTSLMISFYFKGGRQHLGCEFLHKSFREYLYAEAIVETLKEYGRKPPTFSGRRLPYWKDFGDSDPRRQFSRDLAKAVCPRVLTAEISSHLASLIEWEVRRSHRSQREGEISATLKAVTAHQWVTIRQYLEDLWDWWGEGVHLRPQPYRDESDNLRYQPAFVNELLDHSLPLDRGPDAPEWWPGRIVNCDANVGDALCRLNGWVHGLMLKISAWDGPVNDTKTFEQVTDTEHPYQTIFQKFQSVYVLFRPAGAGNYFTNYCLRINAPGNRHTSFPGLIDLSYADFQNADLHKSNFAEANLFRADFGRANLRGANLNGANLAGANLSGADLNSADLKGANFLRANLSGANLNGADLTGANLNEAILIDAKMNKTPAR